MQQNRWQAAIGLLSQVLTIDRQYRDAATKLRYARQAHDNEVKQRELARLYERAVESTHAEEWEQAISSLEEIIQSDPDYADAKYFLSKARGQRREQLEERKRQQELAGLYSQCW